MSTHLAIDIGGSHGRCYLGQFGEGEPRITEIGSFSTAPINVGEQLCWDVEGMHRSILGHLRRVTEYTPKLDSIAIDSMGLAFTLLDGRNELLCPAMYTRTAQSDVRKQEIIEHFGRDELYAINGLEQQKLNTLYYLTVLHKDHPEIISRTAHILMLPDYLNYMLTGTMSSERTIASTSALWDVRGDCWSEEILRYVGLTPSVISQTVENGAILGRLHPEIASIPGLSDTVVVSVAAHDTASAFYALDDADAQQLLISSGTWGMIGCINDCPVLTREALDSHFANEGAADGKIKLLNNAPCMSILEACMKRWRADGAVTDWPQLFDAARAVGESGIRLDLYDARLRDTDDMPESIRRCCIDAGQSLPASPGEFAAAVLESVAANYADSKRSLEKIGGRSFDYAVMVGGGVRNEGFLQLCSDALGLPVKAGPPEASVYGNLKAQRVAFAFVKENFRSVATKIKKES